MKKSKILFLCLHNSARSQMAEAYMKKFGSNYFDAESAGLEAGKLNPLAVAVMKEDGIDISASQTKDVFDFFKQGKIFQYVITVCDPEASDRCPVFPGMMAKINWSFADPSKFEGSREEKLAQTRMVRDQIREGVQSFISQHVPAE